MKALQKEIANAQNPTSPWENTEEYNQWIPDHLCGFALVTTVSIVMVSTNRYQRKELAGMFIAPSHLPKNGVLLTGPLVRMPLVFALLLLCHPNLTVSVCHWNLCMLLASFRTAIRRSVAHTDSFKWICTNSDFGMAWKQSSNLQMDTRIFLLQYMCTKYKHSR
jgi:hypothetical protein